MLKQYTLKDLLALKIEGKRVLTIADIQYACSDISRQAVYDILNGKAAIYTSELHQLCRHMRERGFEITVENLDLDGLKIRYYPNK